MIRRWFAGSLALLIALSGAPELRAQVVSEAARAGASEGAASAGARPELSESADGPLSGESAGAES